MGRNSVGLHPPNFMPQHDAFQNLNYKRILLVFSEFFLISINHIDLPMLPSVSRGQAPEIKYFGSNCWFFVVPKLFLA